MHLETPRQAVLVVLVSLLALVSGVVAGLSLSTVADDTPAVPHCSWHGRLVPCGVMLAPEHS